MLYDSPEWCGSVLEFFFAKNKNSFPNPSFSWLWDPVASKNLYVRAKEDFFKGSYRGAINSDAIFGLFGTMPRDFMHQTNRLRVTTTFFSPPNSRTNLRSFGHAQIQVYRIFGTLRKRAFGATKLRQMNTVLARSIFTAIPKPPSKQQKSEISNNYNKYV